MIFKNKALFKTLAAGVLVLGLAACEKGINDDIITPAAEVKFTTPVGTVGKYFITNSPSSAWKVPVGFTTVSDKDRTVTFTYTSSTGAAQGTHYSAPQSITIPAGKVVDTLVIKGLFATFTGVKHNLSVKVSSPDAATANADNTYTLEIQRTCPVNVTDLLGAYTKTYDYSNGSTTADWGPYATGITPTTPGVYGTKDTLRISNFWDYGNPLDLEIDWTDGANLKTTVIDSYVFTHSTYGAIRAKSRGTGTFSSCDQTFTVNFSLYASAGTFSDTYTTTLKR